MRRSHMVLHAAALAALVAPSMVCSIESIHAGTTGGGNGTGKHAKDTTGRKGADKQEVVPDKEALASAIPGVVKALKEQDEASDKANKKVKAVAKSTGFMASVVRKIAKASMGEDETFEKAKRDAEQLSLAFEAIEK